MGYLGTNNISLLFNSWRVGTKVMDYMGRRMGGGEVPVLFFLLQFLRGTKRLLPRLQSSVTPLITLTSQFLHCVFAFQLTV